MGNFNKGGFGGGKKFGGGGRGGDRGGNRGGFGGRGNDRERPEMHRATCDECGKGCEVPFRPSGEKPVFCSDCFENKRDGGNDRGGDRGDRGNRGFDKRDSQPRFGDRRPSRNEGGNGGENYKAQLQQINDTLYKILKALTNESEETKKEEGVKVDRHEKAPKKKVDATELKQTLNKVIETVTPAKKSAPKKKAPAKKKATPKKVAPKKATGKKTTAKKK